VSLRGWLVDLLSAAVATALAVANTLLGWPLDAGQRRTALLLAVLSGLAMAATRRWPGPVLLVQATLLLVTDALSPLTASVSVALVLTALGVLAYRHGWVAAAVGATGAYAVGVAHMASSGSNVLALPEGIVRLVTTAGLTAAPVAFGRYLRGVRRAAAVAEERAAEAEARRVVETRAARLAERTRLASDLHDIVAHHIGAMTLRASSGRLALDGGDQAAASAALADVAAAGRAVLDELRQLLTVLRDPDAVETPALPADPEAEIGDAAERVRAAGVPVAVEVDPRLARAPLPVRATVARVVQEALTNVLKHAGPGTASTVTVTAAESGMLRTQVVNARPAHPRPALPASGHGLAGMRERVALLGGVLVAGPTPERGWSVVAELPGAGQS
jgi:signal transduction histidine kinase